MKIMVELDRVVSYYPQLARALGSPEAAIYMQQLYFWSDKGKRSDGFIYKTKDEIESETALGRDRQDLLRKKMEQLGVLETKLMRANGSPTLHYKVNTKALQDSISGFSDSRQTHYSNSGNDTILITETTTENTALPNGKGVPQEDVDNNNHDSEIKIPSSIKQKESDDGLESGELIEEFSRDVDDLTTNKIKPTRGEPEINEIVDKFEAALDLKMNRIGKQRIAARNLLRRYSIKEVKEAIDAVVLVRDEEYAPVILSLEDLWNKWNNIKEFYRKRQVVPAGRMTVLRDE